jgi:hypothetical protein
VVCPAKDLLFLSVVAVSSTPPYRDDIDKSWIARWKQGEQLRAETDTKWKQRYQSFLLPLVDIWA